ncbi:MAG: slipin family protein, partial [Limnobacter sp.]|nr:slipin family protein [Limnobacter sp.]
RERRAKVINAEGEQQAAQKLLEAAEVLSRVPEAMQLRYLATLSVIGTQNNSTIVFPFPTDLGRTLSSVVDGLRSGGGTER